MNNYQSASQTKKLVTFVVAVLSFIFYFIPWFHIRVEIFGQNVFGKGNYNFFSLAKTIKSLSDLNSDGANSLTPFLILMGILLIICFIITLVLLFFDKKQAVLPYLIAYAVNFIAAIFVIISFDKEVGNEDYGYAAVGASITAAAIIGLILVIIMAVMYYSKKDFTASYTNPGSMNWNGQQNFNNGMNYGGQQYNAGPAPQPKPQQPQAGQQVQQPQAGQQVQQPEKIFCTNCGAENRPGAKFCTHCGTPLEK